MTPVHVPVDSADARERDEHATQAVYVSVWYCLACGDGDATYVPATNACVACGHGPLMRVRI